MMIHWLVCVYDKNQVHVAIHIHVPWSRLMYQNVGFATNIT